MESEAYALIICPGKPEYYSQLHNYNTMSINQVLCSLNIVICSFLWLLS